MLIDFEQKQTFNQTINIEDPGNCCVKCENEEFMQWYLIVKSIRGISHYLEFGPILPDSSDLPAGFSCYYGQLKFNEKKLYGLISGFLNDSKKQISSACEESPEIALEDFSDVATLYRNLQ